LSGGTKESNDLHVRAEVRATNSVIRNRIVKHCTKKVREDDDDDDKFQEDQSFLRS
jgi:hypothetical protein